jgi:SAM-dependent methyltransferases related to tRNA (uracil-5-)-methyltransferase
MSFASEKKELEIEALDELGRGIASLGTQKVKIPFMIPGERIRVDRSFLTLLAAKKTAPLQGVEWLETSPDRVDPPCPYFGECGGCQLQHTNLERQLLEKHRFLLRLFQDKVSPELILPVVPSPRPWHYRRRIQLHVGPQGEVGFFAAFSHRVVDIKTCRIAEEALNQKIEEVRKAAAQEITQQRRVNLITYELTFKPDGKVEIYKGEIKRRFLQANPFANQKLLQWMQGIFSQISPQNVLELFAGDGNFSYALRDRAQAWTAVEANPAAVERAKQHPNAARMRWIASESAKALRGVKPDEYDLLVLDPPREGAWECIKSIKDLKFSRVIYISCAPLSLLKDLKGLLGSYEVEQMQPFDFFPQTMHLETVAVLRRIS